MLYHLYDLQHAMMSPSRVFAESLQHLFSHPLLPISYTRFGRAIAAGSEIFERSTRRYKKPEFGLDSTVIDGEPAAVELVTEARKPFCDLLHFRRDTTRSDPKVLLVAPLSQPCCAAPPRRCCPTTTSTSPTGSMPARCRASAAGSTSTTISTTSSPSCSGWARTST
jgi:hypothetical protein